MIKIYFTFILLIAYSCNLSKYNDTYNELELADEHIDYKFIDKEELVDERLTPKELLGAYRLINYYKVKGGFYDYIKLDSNTLFMDTFYLNKYSFSDFALNSKIVLKDVLWWAEPIKKEYHWTNLFSPNDNIPLYFQDYFLKKYNCDIISDSLMIYSFFRGNHDESGCTFMLINKSILIYEDINLDYIFELKKVNK